MSITLSHRSLMFCLSGCAQAWFAAGAYAEAADWQIDPDHFSIVFEADHIGYQQQLGFFLEGSGRFRFDPETDVLSSGSVEIVSGSLFSNHDARDNHLKGRDFLNARRHALIVFEVSEYFVADGVLRGNLTMLDETHPVNLEVVVNKQAVYPFGHRKELWAFQPALSSFVVSGAWIMVLPTKWSEMKLSCVSNSKLSDSESAIQRHLTLSK